ncbi:MAG: hypothetical protein H8E25_09665 [Planctomycetes bacterium]|nr:hypothetical protein [Planctomycetota bacterium]
MNKSPSPYDISSTQQRIAMLQKLESLMAVLEATQRKVDLSLESPFANRERLQKVRTQVGNTLSVCRHARRALEQPTAITDEDINQVDFDELFAKLGNL